MNPVTVWEADGAEGELETDTATGHGAERMDGWCQFQV